MATIKFTISAAPAQVSAEGVTKFIYMSDVTEGAPTAGVYRGVSVVGEGVILGTTVGITTIAAAKSQKAKVKIVATDDVLSRGEYTYTEGYKQLEYTGMSDTQAILNDIRTAVVEVIRKLIASLDDAAANENELTAYKKVAGSMFSSDKGEKYLALKGVADELESAPLTRTSMDDIDLREVAVADGLIDDGEPEVVSLFKGEFSTDVDVPVDGLPQILRAEATDNSLFQDFLIIGVRGRESDSRELYIGDDDTAVGMFGLLEGISVALGVSYEFDQEVNEIIKNPPTPPPPSLGETLIQSAQLKIAALEDIKSLKDEVTEPAKPAPAAAVATDSATDSTGATTDASGSTSSAATPGPAPGAPVGAVPSKKDALSDTILFRYVIFGADTEADAQMRIVLNDGNVYDYVISKDRIGSFQSFIVNGSNRDGFKNNLRTYAKVTITARPASGGDPVKQTNEIYIPQSLTEDIVYHFRFSPSRGWTKNTGEAVGNRSAGRVSNPQGDVYCVYWTVSGGVAEGMVDAQIRVSGKTYTVTFAGEPLLVPIELDINSALLSEGRLPIAARKKILNEAVPHWIFLRPTAGDASAGGGGGSRGGGGARDKQRMKVNIAVSELTFTTTQKWVTIPNTGNVVTLENFSFKAAESLAGKQLPDSAKGVTLALDGLKKQGYNTNSVTDEVFRVLFENSEAWRRVGGDQLNCWIKDQTVVGTYSSLTTREGYRYV